MELLKMSAVELGRKIKNHEISVQDAAKASLDRINSIDGSVNSFITVFDDIMEQAEIIQKGIDCGKFASPLAGVPIAIKDNICMKGKRTTCGSKMLSNFISPYDAGVVSSLKNAGMLIIGKLNMDEFAMGSRGEYSYFGSVKNPHDLKRCAGGSSAGSAAAVASDEVFCSLGSDTGGSVRLPAAHCGVVGLKPTYGTVSRYGLIAYGSSLDQIGPIGKCSEDTAALLDIIRRRDSRDSSSVEYKGEPALSSLKSGIAGIKIGIPTELFADGIDNEVRQSVMNCAERLRELGAQTEEFSLPLTDYLTSAYYIIACAQAASNLSRFDGVKYGYRAENCNTQDELYINSRSEGFGMEVKRRIMLGNFVLSSDGYEAYYLKALKTADMIKTAYLNALRKYDILLSPVSPTAAPKTGEKSTPLQTYLSDIYTVSANITGLPAIAFPCGVNSENMPVGAQLIGRPFEENLLLRAVYAYENSL